MHKISKLLITFALLAPAAVVFTACGAGSGTGTTSDIAATVNGKSIMLKEVDYIISQQTGGQQAQMSPLQLAQARLQVLNGLIQKEVMFQRAEKEKLVPSEEEITQEVNKQKQQANMTEEEFQKWVKDQGQTLEAVRDEARKKIAIQRLQDKVTGKITISDKEVEDYYVNNKQQFVDKRGAGLAAIVVDPADNNLQNDAKGELEAKQKIDRLYQRLKSNGDFATIAREESEDPNSNVNGGDIGYAAEEELKQNGFPAELIAQFLGPMQIGEYTQPVRFSNGHWYIFKLTRKQLQTENLTLETKSPNVRQQITDGLLNQRKQILNAALLEVAMNEAKVNNNLASTMLNNPSNLGLRPAASGAVAAPAASIATTNPQTTAPAATSSPVAAASPKATTSTKP
ncbi:MAG TPA: SurA N-terminal domain-containing protein [Pyrinomonadaceae bacterium]